jgi:hypothetical protein
VHRVELVDEPARPVVEHGGDRRTIRDPEREVQIGEAVPIVHRERSHRSSGDHAGVLLGQAQHAIAELVPLLNAEHARVP